MSKVCISEGRLLESAHGDGVYYQVNCPSPILLQLTVFATLYIVRRWVLVMTSHFHRALLA